MRKAFAGLFIMMMGLFFVACSGSSDIRGLIEKAKAEGENWTRDEWKEAFREATKAAVPMIKEKIELSKRYEEAYIKEDKDLMAQLEKEEKDFKVKYKDLTDQLEDFDDIARESKIGNKVRKDKEFKKIVFEELGINPDDL